MGYNYTWGDNCNYEFGNGYAESHTDLNDDLHPKHGHGINYAEWPHDICSGPTADTIAGSHITLKPSKTGVEKTIGHGYGYVKGNSIEIVVGNKEEKHWGDSWEYSHGGTHVEKVYGGRHEEYHYTSDGHLTSKEISENGVKQEWAWDPVTQGIKLTSYSVTNTNGGNHSFTYELNDKVETSVNLVASVTATIDVASENKFSLFGKLSDIDIGVGFTVMSIKIAIGGAPLKVEIEGYAGNWDKFEANFGPLKTKAAAHAAEVANELAVKIKNESMNIVSEKLRLASQNANLTNSQVRLSNSLLQIFT
jgi:hypothetical protein